MEKDCGSCEYYERCEDGKPCENCKEECVNSKVRDVCRVCMDKVLKKSSVKNCKEVNLT